MAYNIENILEEVEGFKQIQGISPDYVWELKGFLTKIHQTYSSDAERKEYSGLYAAIVGRALKRIVDDHKINNETANLVRTVCHELGEKHGVITTLPIIVEDTSPLSIVPGAKLVDIYMMLPDATKVLVLNENECYKT